MTRPRITVSRWRFGAAITLMACGVLLVVSAQASRGSDLRTDERVELVDLVRHQDEQNRELTDRIDELTTQIDDLRASSSTSESDEIQEQIDRIAMAAGMTPVVGPGLSIALEDATLPKPIPPEVNVEDYLVHQQDVEGVLNALWAGGAEAVTVNDQRIVSTSRVQCVGPVLLINGRAYYQPFVIEAIGNALDMQKALDESPAVSAYRSQAEVIDLGFDMEIQEEITMPAYDGALGVTEGQ